MGKLRTGNKRHNRAVIALQAKKPNVSDLPAPAELSKEGLKS